MGTVRAVKRLAAVVAVLALLAAGAAFWLLRPAPVPEATTAVDYSIEVGSYRGQTEACLNPAVTPQIQSSKCLLDLAHTASAAGAYGAALAVLREGVQRSEDMVGRCHNATHEIGRAMVKAGVPYLQVYKMPFTDCRFGLYHGALQEHVKGMSIDELTAAMPTLCTYFGDASQNATQECVHVTGHFVVDLIGTDIRKSLAACDVYDEETLRSRCADGVFMQEIDLSRPGVNNPTSADAKRVADTWGTGRDEQSARLVGLCREQKVPTIRYVCYTAVSQALAVLWNADYRAVDTVCTQLPADGVQPCFEGVAASAFTLADWHAEKIADACHAVDHDGSKYCMRSLALTYGMQDSADRAGLVCRLARGAEEQKFCQDGIDAGQRIAGEMAANVTSPRDPGAQGPGATSPSLPTGPQQ